MLLHSDKEKEKILTNHSYKIQMMEKLEIGLKPVVTYEVDYNFFNEFVDE